MSRGFAPSRLRRGASVGYSPRSVGQKWSSSLSAVPKWSIGLTALIGAWVGHFAEYVRVSGWHTAVAEMGGSVHTYFFPAGAALTAAAFGLAVVARRAWRLLGKRIAAAEIGLWKRPSTLPPTRGGRAPGAVGVAALWPALALLQTITWVIQENLEALGSGRRAPLLGVVSGAHWLAPVVIAEVALILAAVYSLVHHWFGSRRSKLVVLERLVVRRWRRRPCLRPVASQAVSVPSTPLKRWGRQRWLRPPPAFLPTV